MIDIFKTYIDPASKESFRGLSLDQNSYKMEWIVQPEGYVPLEHIHLHQNETFLIQEGEILLLIDGEKFVGKVGDVITVPKGKRHIAYNNAQTVLKCEVSYTPSLDILQFEQCFMGMLQDGHYDKTGKIKIPMMGYFLSKMKCQSMTRPTEIPAFVFAFALKVFYLVGVIRGWKKYYTAYTGLS
ncbi:MAG: cupin domain-containing protein [Spirosomataceae bacterium]